MLSNIARNLVETREPTIVLRVRNVVVSHIALYRVVQIKKLHKRSGTIILQTYVKKHSVFSILL